MRTVRRALSVAVLALAVLAPVVAGQGPPRDRSGDREQLEQRVRARMAQVIRERLGLTAEEGARLDAIMESFHEQRRALRREEWALRQSVSALGEGGSMGEADAREVLERMVELREEEVRLFRDEQEALLEVLTAEQLLTFQALRDRIGDRIRELRRGRGGGRGPGGPAGPPGFGLFQER